MPEDFDYGQVVDGKYVNGFFNVQVTLPVGWTVKSKGELDSINQLSRELYAGDDKKLKALSKVSEISSAQLLMVSKYKSDTIVDFNPNLLIQAENVSRARAIKSGKDYLTVARKQMLKSNFPFNNIDSVFSPVMINGTEFYKMGLNIDVNGQYIEEEMYATILKGFSFHVIVTYTNPSEKEEMLRSIHTLRISKESK
jgi:hypothetical protein